MHPDNELAAWQQQWQRHDAVPPDLQRRVDRDIRNRKLGFVLACLVTAGFGGGTTWWAATSGRADVVVLAIAVWIFIAITWVTARTLDGRIGWKPAATTTSAFVDYSIRSVRAKRQAVVAAAVLYAALYTFMLGWRYNELSAIQPVDLWAYLTSSRTTILWGITAVLGAFAIWRRRTLTRELANLEALRRALNT